MLISFQKLIRKCIHKNKKRKFHNRIGLKKLRELFTLLHAKLQAWNDKTFNQIQSLGKRECREVSPDEKDEKVKDFASLGNSQEIKRIILGNPLYQLRISEQARMTGIVEKNFFNEKLLAEEEKINKDLFYVLYYDFEHTSHPNPKKEQIKEENLICILDEKCLAYNNFFSEEED